MVCLRSDNMFLSWSFWMSYRFCYKLILKDQYNWNLGFQIYQWGINILYMWDYSICSESNVSSYVLDLSKFAKFRWAELRVVWIDFWTWVVELFQVFLLNIIETKIALMAGRETHESNWATASQVWTDVVEVTIKRYT